MSYPFFDIEIIASSDCLVRCDQVVARTWRERLFSWPWKPFRPTKIVTHYEPDPNLFMIGPNRYVGHPATIARLQARLAHPPAPPKPGA